MPMSKNLIKKNEEEEIAISRPVGITKKCSSWSNDRNSFHMPLESLVAPRCGLYHYMLHT